MTPLPFDLAASSNLVGELLRDVTLQLSEQFIMRRGIICDCRFGEKRVEQTVERLQTEIYRGVAKFRTHGFLRRDSCAQFSNLVLAWVHASVSSKFSTLDGQNPLGQIDFACGEEGFAPNLD